MLLCVYTTIACIKRDEYEDRHRYKSENMKVGKIRLFNPYIAFFAIIVKKGESTECRNYSTNESYKFFILPQFFYIIILLIWFVLACRAVGLRPIHTVANTTVSITMPIAM